MLCGMVNTCIPTMHFAYISDGPWMAAPPQETTNVHMPTPCAIPPPPRATQPADATQVPYAVAGMLHNCTSAVPSCHIIADGPSQHHPRGKLYSISMYTGQRGVQANTHHHLCHSPST